MKKKVLTKKKSTCSVTEEVDNTTGGNYVNNAEYT